VGIEAKMIRCRQCKSELLHAVRLMVQIQDDVNSPHSRYGWQDTGEVAKDVHLVCDDCGHSWKTRRLID
jgi:DNA-directed RNA polymerase subunit RPC12/RpoP